MPIKVPVDWVPRSYQLPLWSFLENGGRRAVSVWHRRAGKDATALNWTVTQAIQRVGLYWHLLPTYNQGRKIVWDGRTREGRAFLDAWPKEYIVDKNETDMRLRLKNGSIWQVVGTDNVDRLVGSNVLGCVFSEYSLQDPKAWDLIRPILAENGGWALFIYTPRGRNHGYDLLQMALKNMRIATEKGVRPTWYGEILTVDSTKRPDGTPVIHPDAIQEERDAGMPEEMVQQEFYCSFDSSLVGAYFGQQMTTAQKEGRITKVPWEPKLEVGTAWDLGIDDSMSIWFYQVHSERIRVIDYYESSGEGIPHYVKVMREKPYVYGRNMQIAPHDISVRELNDGKSRWETAKSLGVTFRINKRESFEDGIEACRSLIPRCWFDEDKCERGINGLKQYSKEWDSERKVFKSTEVRDWTCHPAAAFRTLAMGLKMKRKRSQLPQAMADNEYNALAA